MNELEKLEQIHCLLPELIGSGIMPHDVEKAIGVIKDIQDCIRLLIEIHAKREPYLKAKETNNG